MIKKGGKKEKEKRMEKDFKREKKKLPWASLSNLGKPFQSFSSLENPLLSLDGLEGPTNFYFQDSRFNIVFFLKKRKKKKRNTSRNICSQVTVFHLANRWHVVGKSAMTKMTLFPGY